jgi:hypothetical protein
MQAPATQLDAGQLRDLCDQFEQGLLASLLPTSLFTGLTTEQQSSETSEFAPSAVGSQLFRQALAAAIERSGGIGLGAEFARVLSRNEK